jgi:hypothetical protein
MILTNSLNLFYKNNGAKIFPGPAQMRQAQHTVITHQMLCPGHNNPVGLFTRCLHKLPDLIHVTG